MSEADPFDWLEKTLEVPQELIPAPPATRASPPALHVEDVPGWREFVECARKLAPEQRVLLDALGRSGFNLDAARQRVKDERGLSITRQRADRWLCTPAFIDARSRLEDFAILRSGLSAAAVLARLDEISRAASQMLPVKDADGKVLYEKPVDAKTAVATLKLLGEYRNLWKADNAPAAQAPSGPGLSITFIHGTAPQTARVGETIDAEVIEVPTPNRSKS
jgi:hypothetical protein